MHRQQGSGDGKGTVVLDEQSASDETQRDEICARLRTLFNAPNYAPPVLPAAAMEVYRLSRLKDVKIAQILLTIEKDPLLAARVVRSASSPAYGGLAIHSLQMAVVRIGLSNLAELVWEVALNMRVFRSRAYEAPMNAVRKHSVAVAHTCRLVAKLTSVPLEYAFLCGLLHDVGAAAALHVLGDEPIPDGKPLRPDLLDLVLSSAHADASQLVARLWKLPDDLQLVLGSHHTVMVAGHAHPTAAIITVAEQILREAGGAFSLLTESWDSTSESTYLRARDALGISEAALTATEQAVKTMLEKLGSSD